MKKTIYIIALALLSILLIIGNPSRSRFLKTVSDDYGSFHQGMDLSPEQLERIGTSDYHSYILFSLYTYQFGNMSISYFGFAFMTFYTGSAVLNKENQRKQLTNKHSLISVNG